MPYYEVLFETGRMSTMNCADDEEVNSFIAEQQRRAENGEPGGPIGQPAERIAKVYVYPKHPDDYNMDQTMSADVLKSEVGTLIDKLADENGVVSTVQLSQEVQSLAHPMKNERTGAFDSMYKMEHEREVDLGYLKGGGKK